MGTALEVYALRKQDHDATFSRFTRRVFKTHTPLGKAAFLVGSAVFIVHILRSATSEVADTS